MNKRAAASKPVAVQRRAAANRRRRPLMIFYNAIGPARMPMTLQYVDQTYLLTGVVAGEVVENVFRLNSPFDPDYTGIGDQPRGFDEWMAIYSWFTVLSTDVEVTTTAAATVPMYLGFYPDSGTGVAANADDALSRADKLVSVSATTGGVATNTIKRHYDISRLVGRPVVPGNIDFRVSTGAGPTIPAYLHVFVCRGGLTGVTASSVDYVLKMKMNGIFTEPRRLAEG
jgi:hypothetical protein